MKVCKRYEDDTVCFVKTESVENIFSILNSFDVDITFTYEMQKKCRLLFFDVLLTRNGNNIVTTVYSKTTTDDLHLNQNSFALDSWKRRT